MHYDPLIAKLITYGDQPQGPPDRMNRALDSCVIRQNNVTLLPCVSTLSVLLLVLVALSRCEYPNNGWLGACEQHRGPQREFLLATYSMPPVSSRYATLAVLEPNHQVRQSA